MTLERLFAAWREAYVVDTPAANIAPDGHGSIFAALLHSEEPDERTRILWRGELTFAILNAYPYGSGHLMVLPNRVVGELEDLGDDEVAELWGTVGRAVRALKAAYQPEGINIGANLGRGAGAGIPGHLHIHVLPRWTGDTNFMTTVAETRVLPESLDAGWAKIRAAWPR